MSAKYKTPINETLTWEQFKKMVEYWASVEPNAVIQSIHINPKKKGRIFIYITRNDKPIVKISQEKYP
jgi:hypothetical protein